MVLKRALDIAASALSLPVLLPVMVLIAIIIKLDSSGPVFFRQVRVGRGGRPFRIFKFRSMVVDAPKTGTALTVDNDPRITRAGRLLRRSKLDELPQVLNILAGDMSIVGPRPEVPEFMKLYSPEQRSLILSMRPGMTDYAAILFHDESSLLERNGNPIELYRTVIMPIKFRCYERYSHDSGMLTDLRIIMATAFLLIAGREPRWLSIHRNSICDHRSLPATSMRSQTCKREDISSERSGCG